MLRPWKPGSWSGETVVVLAGGPSLTPGLFEQVRGSGLRAIAINDSFERAPWASALYAADTKWWRCHPAAHRFVGDRVCAERDAVVPGGWWLEAKPADYPRNSALNVTEFAVANGAARVLLLGVDLDVRCLTHHHGLHRTPLRNPTVSSFRAALKAWAALGRSTDVPIINCNPDSALKCFPRMPLHEALA